MTKTEKIYFKKYALANALKAGPNYKKLFDAIARQETYDEKALLARFRGEAFTRQFAVAKNYLYKLVLRSLEACYQNSDKELASMCNQAEILLKKNLFAACHTLLKSAKKAALEKERFGFLPRLLRTEWSLVLRTDIQGLEREHNDRLLEESKKALALSANELEYHHLYNRVYLAGNKAGISRDAQQLAELEELMQHPLLADPARALSARAKSSIHKSFASHGFTIGSHALTYEHMEALVQLLEKYPQVFEASVNYRLNVLGNLCNSCIGLQRMDEAIAICNRMEALEVPVHREHIQRIELVTLQRMNIYGRSAQFEKALETARRFENDYEKNSPYFTIVARLILPCSCAYAEFIHGGFAAALRWINRVLNTKHDGFRKDILALLRILECMVHYELGHFDLLEYKLKSAYKELLAKNNLFRTERTVLRGLKKLIDVSGPGQRLKLFTDLKEELRALEQDPRESLFFQNADLVSWAESKTSGQPMLGLLAAKIKKS